MISEEKEMKTVPNQKVIEKRKENCSTGQITYVSHNAIFYALKNLSSNGFKFWSYLLTINFNKQWALSGKDACEKCLFSQRTYNTVVKELIEKKFLIPGKQKNGFIFVDFPLGQEEKKQNFYLYKYVFNDNIVYIGQTTSLKRRVQQHTQDKLYNFKGEIYYTNCGSKKELDLLEAILINKYKPEFNITHKNREDLNYDLIKDNLNLDWILYKIIE